MLTVNVTLKIDEHELINFESWLRQQLEVVSLKVIPDTEQLYLNDPIFKKLVHNVKTASKLRDEYINKMNV
jgi:hypothetical protein